MASKQQPIDDCTMCRIRHFECQRLAANSLMQTALEEIHVLPQCPYLIGSHNLDMASGAAFLCRSVSDPVHSAQDPVFPVGNRMFSVLSSSEKNAGLACSSGEPWIRNVSVDRVSYGAVYANAVFEFEPKQPARSASSPASLISFVWEQANSKMVGELRAADISLMAITAEPGGDEAVRQRLADRGVADLDYDVKSDPGHTLLVKDAGDVYVFKPHDWEVSGPYSMIQPAVVVVDGEGNVIKECTWSWKTMGYGDGKEMDMVPYQGKEYPLVTYRPVISDLVASVKEKRPIKLAPAKF